MIYVGYGIPKSASSFVFQIVLALLERRAADRGEELLTLPDLFDPASENARYVDDLITGYLGLPGSDERPLEAVVELLLEELGPSRSIALKTHLPCSPALRRRIDEGVVQASATFRHPAEMMLSLRDMRGREGWELEAEKAAEVVAAKARALQSWADSEAVPLLSYDRIAGDPVSVEAALARQLGVEVEPGSIVGPMLEDAGGSIWQYNRGVLGRRHRELEAAAIERCERMAPELSRLVAAHERGEQDARPLTRVCAVTPIEAPTDLPELDRTIRSVLTQRGCFSIHHHIALGIEDPRLQQRLERWSRLCESGDLGGGCEGARLSWSGSGAGPGGAPLRDGLEAADGDLLTLLEVGDQLEPGAVQTVTEVARTEHGVAILLGSIVPVRSDGVPASSGEPLAPVRARLSEAGAMADPGFPIVSAGVFWTGGAWAEAAETAEVEEGAEAEADGECSPVADAAGLRERWARIARRRGAVALAAPVVRIAVEQLAGRDDSDRGGSAAIVFCTWPERSWTRRRVSIDASGWSEPQDLLPPLPQEVLNGPAASSNDLADRIRG